MHQHREIGTHTRYPRERRHSRQAEIDSQAGKDPHVPDVPDEGPPPESPHVAFSTTAAGAQRQGTGEEEPLDVRQAGFPPLREVEKVPPAPGEVQSAQRKEWAGQSPPWVAFLLLRGEVLGGWEQAGGSQVQIQAWYTEGGAGAPV